MGFLNIKYLKTRETQIELLEAFKVGRFTPFLGAGASSLRPENLPLLESPWCEVVEALKAINSSINRPEDRIHLRSFFRERLRPSLSDLEAILPLDAFTNANPISWVSEKLLRLQCAIVALSSVLAEQFGLAFAGKYHSVLNASDCAVTLSAKRIEDNGIVALLTDMVDAAADLRRAGQTSWRGPEGQRERTTAEPFIEAEKIYSKLVQLTFELITKEIWFSPSFSKWHPKHAGVQGFSLSDPRDLPLNEISLRLDHLAWLADLLWYTLRFWIPFYPTTSELAFELALLAYLTPPRKAELAQAAEAMLDDRVLVSRLQKLFGYYETSVPPSLFHLYLAAAVHQTYTHYKQQLQWLESTRHVKDLQAQNNSMPVTPALPIAFTTNFDRALEKALEETLKTTYHVIYPAEKGKTIKWQYRTIYRKDEKIRDFPESGECDDLGPEGRRSDISPELFIPFKGPIIVKLHGSPLDPLSGEDKRHWVVLSESGYLEAMIHRREALPDWIEDQLRISPAPPRSLWFLGYSVSDWNIRLRLYEHVCHTLQSDRNDSKPVKSALDRNKGLDSFRSSIFKRLEIQLCLGDLNDLGFSLHSVLRELSSSQSLSAEVERFLKEVEEKGTAK